MIRTVTLLIVCLALPTHASAQPTPRSNSANGDVQVIASVPIPARHPQRRATVPPQKTRSSQRVFALPRPRPSRPQRRVASAAPGVQGTGCVAQLRRLGVVAERVPAIREGACGAPEPYRVTEVAGVSLSTPATLRCGVAKALAGWVRDGLQPAARQHLRGSVTGLRVAASYHCRMRRNGGRGRPRLSEHGLANAIDISAFTLTGGRTVTVGPASGKKRGEARFLAAVREAACGPFKTVLGPGSDSAHERHFHFDSAQRRNGSTYCR